MESGKAEPYRDSVGVKRMQMNAHGYKAICKRKWMDVLSGKLNLHSQLASSANQEVQSGKAEFDLQSIGVKRKETDDQSYKAKSKKTQMVDTLPGKLNLHLQIVSSALQEQDRLCNWVAEVREAAYDTEDNVLVFVAAKIVGMTKLCYMSNIIGRKHLKETAIQISGTSTQFEFQILE